MRTKISIALAALVALSLTSCSNPFDKGGETFDQVMQWHKQAVLAEFDALNSATFVGKIAADGALEVNNIGSGTEMGSIKATIKTEGKQKASQSEQDATITISGKTKDGDASGTLGLGLVTDGSGLYLKLNTVDFKAPPSVKSEELQQINMALTMAKGMLVGNWIKLDATTPGMTQEVMTAEKLRKIMEKTNVLKMTKDLGYSDGRYHYEVVSDDAAFLALMKELNPNIESLTESGAKAPVSVVGTLEIEKSNKLHAKFSGTITPTEETGKSEALRLEFDLDTGKLVVNASTKEWAFSMNLSASNLTTLAGPISIKSTDGKTDVSGTITLSKDGDKRAFAIELKDKDGMTIKANLNSTMTADPSVTVTIPATFTTIQELMAKFLGSAGVGGIPDTSSVGMDAAQSAGMDSVGSFGNIDASGSDGDE